jgi:hypothetical protein
VSIRQQFLFAPFLPVLVVSTAMASDLLPRVPAPPPMVISNSDGRILVQKVHPIGTRKDDRVEKGLVIVPQVVVPIVPTPERKR